ncbi:MAG: hypothetical protein IJA27_08915 [Lachnospiraceae bacterium]|nr:hypothetical protein [Lachnospiraceae bacterium]
MRKDFKKVVKKILGVTVWASLSYSNFTNVTLYTSAHPTYLLEKNETNYVEILNTAHETYGDCMVKVGFIVDAAGNHSGRWRPDV